jgi:hypothetical protein
MQSGENVTLFNLMTEAQDFLLNPSTNYILVQLVA